MREDHDRSAARPAAEVPPPPARPAAAHAVPWTLADLVAVGALVLFVVAPLTSTLVGTLVPAPQAEALGFVAVMLAAGLTTVVWVALRHRGNVTLLFGRERPDARDLAAGVWHGLVAFFGLNLVLGLLFTWLTEQLGVDVGPVQERIRDLAADPALVPFVLLSVGIAAPLAEELFFRGLVFQWLRHRAGVVVGVVGSGIIFGLVHWESGNPVGTAYMVVSLSLVGVYLAWVFQRRGSLLAPIAMHATFNLLAAGWILQGFG